MIHSILPQAHQNQPLSGASARLVHTRPGWTLSPHLMLHHLPSHSAAWGQQFHSKATESQRTPPTRAGPPTGHAGLREFLNSFAVKQNLEEKISTFEKQQQKISPSTPEQNSLSYLECDQSGFPIKAWETPTRQSPQ